MAPRLRLAGALPLLLAVVVLAQLGALPCEGDALRLRGSVACLDCAAGHDLSGVVVAVKCGGHGAALHATQTDGRGSFDVAMPAVPASATPCAARVLGATERLCAPKGLTVARVVPGPGWRPGSFPSYALGSRLAFFTRCGPGGSADVATATVASDHARAAQRVPTPRPRTHAAPQVRTPGPRAPPMQTPVTSPPRAAYSSLPFGMGGLPLIYFFPFIPIISIP